MRSVVCRLFVLSMLVLAIVVAVCVVYCVSGSYDTNVVNESVFKLVKRVCYEHNLRGIWRELCIKLNMYGLEIYHEYRTNSSFRSRLISTVLNYPIVREFVDGRKVGRCYKIFQQVLDEIEKYKYPLSLMNCVEFYPMNGLVMVYDKSSGSYRMYIDSQLLTVFANYQKVPRIISEEYGNLLKSSPFITCILDLYIDPGTLKVVKYTLTCTPLWPVGAYPPDLGIINRSEPMVVLAIVLATCGIAAVVSAIYFRKRRRRARSQSSS